MLHPDLIPLASLFARSVPLAQVNSHFYLLGDPSSDDHVANVHPPSSLVSDQLLTPCCLTLPVDTPRFMLHVYIDDITTSATLSDTKLSLEPI